jgi:hypothetical protein
MLLFVTSLLHISVEDTHENQPPTFSSYCLSKLERAPDDVQDKIWSEILAYTLYIDLGPISPGDVRKTAIKDWRRMLLFVSKAFHVSGDCHATWLSVLNNYTETRSASLLYSSHHSYPERFASVFRASCP